MRQRAAQRCRIWWKKALLQEIMLPPRQNDTPSGKLLLLRIEISLKPKIRFSDQHSTL
jgi:hypothetical protein